MFSLLLSFWKDEKTFLRDGTVVERLLRRDRTEVGRGTCTSPNLALMIEKTGVFKHFW